MRKRSSSRGLIGSVGLPTVLTGLSLLYLLFRSPKTMAQAIVTPKDTIRQILSAKLNDQNVKFWTAISALETDNWASPIFVHNLNLFGMRLPTSDTTAIGGADGFAVFASLEDSARDLILYFDRLAWPQVNFNTLPELVNMMKLKGYFVESPVDYLNGLRERYKQIYGS